MLSLICGLQNHCTSSTMAMLPARPPRCLPTKETNNFFIVKTFMSLSIFFLYLCYFVCISLSLYVCLFLSPFKYLCLNHLEDVRSRQPRLIYPYLSLTLSFSVSLYSTYILTFYLFISIIQI